MTHIKTLLSKRFAFFAYGVLLTSVIFLLIILIPKKSNNTIRDYHSSSIPIEVLDMIDGFIEIGSRLTKINFVDSVYDVEGRFIGVNPDTIIIPVVSISIDKDKRAEWEKLARDIEENKEQIDEDLLTTFEEILSMFDMHPSFEIPPMKSIVMKSNWSNRTFIAEWASLNNFLRIKVENRINLLEAKSHKKRN